MLFLSFLKLFELSDLGGGMARMGPNVSPMYVFVHVASSKGIYTGFFLF